MSTLSTLQTRLSIELGDSEEVNKTAPQRTQAINDALRQTYEYRDWPNLFLNKDIQGVDGIFNIPRNMDKPAILWYGENSDAFWTYDFGNQTDFFTKYSFANTITEFEGRQVIKFADESNRGHDVYNYTGTSTIGINDDAARQQVGQTFVATESELFGLLLKLNIVGSPEGTLTADIKATALGLPTGSSLATTTIYINELTEDPEYYWSKFVSSVELTEDATYSLTITPSYATSAVNYVEWTYSTTSQITGSQVLYDGGTWSLGAGDQVFVLCSDYYKFQYTTKFIDLVNSNDDTGMPSDFDRAIGKMAAGIMDLTKGEYSSAQIHFYGVGGTNENDAKKDSAYGLLNNKWSRLESIRPNKSLKTVFQRRGLRSRYNYYRKYL